MAVDPYQSLPANFPKPPTTTNQGFTVFPRDLIAPGREFYTELQFVEYTTLTGGVPPFLRTIGSAKPVITGVTGFALPIPRKLNDVQTLIWEEKALNPVSDVASVVSSALSAGGNLLSNTLGNRIKNLAGQAAAVTAGTLAAAAGAGLGIAVNPWLTLMFKSPAFKQFRLDWIFTPNNAEESADLVDILNRIKLYSLPLAVGPAYLYPYILLIKLRPDDRFTFRFKPCAVEQVAIDFTGAGMPSFFKGTNAPTIITLSLTLKEIEIWERGSYNA